MFHKVDPPIELVEFLFSHDLLSNPDARHDVMQGWTMNKMFSNQKSDQNLIQNHYIRSKVVNFQYRNLKC